MRPSLLPVALALAVAACKPVWREPLDVGGDDDDVAGDLDGDGYGADDCDDSDPRRHPDAVELCDGVDQDCDGVVDDGFDADGDQVTTCAGDCQDLDPSIHPGAPEACNAIDDDCSGVADDIPDGDHDGITACAGDCDDSNSNVNPARIEVCNGLDDDCDGVADDGFDQDGDGFTACGGDCNDASADVHPTAPEACNGADDDCDGVPDDGFDQDSDTRTTCGGDCDDASPAVHVGAVEVCDGVDQDCDGLVDEGFDHDGDLSTTCAGDCDDGDPDVRPAQAELCGDGVDNDCAAGDATCVPGAVLALSDADAVIEGQGVGGQAGASLAGVGDVDGDGFPDVLVGAPYLDAGATDTGGVYLIRGPFDGWMSVDGGRIGLLGAASERAGTGVGGGGDVDGDGLADLVATGTGVYLFLGPPPDDIAPDTADATIARTAQAVGVAPDLDGDGYDDLVFADPGDDAAGLDAGAVWVVSGPVYGEMPLEEATAVIRGGSARDGSGQSVAGVGDLDGDGYGDLVIGAPMAEGGGADSGVAFVFYGPVSGELTTDDADAFLRGVSEQDRAGWSVAGAGDLDGDGLDDLLVGAPRAEGIGVYAGACYVVLGPVEGTVSLASAQAVLVGAASFDGAGYSVAPAGDFDGDGWGDVLVGAPALDGTTTGSAYLVRGPFAGLSNLGGADWVFQATAAQDRVGYAVASAGDVDGDGRGDVLIGAPGNNGIGVDTGAVYLVRGRPAP